MSVPDIDLDALRKACYVAFRDTPSQYAEDAMIRAVAEVRDAQWQQRITALEAALTRAEGIARAAERYIQAFDAADEEASIMGGGMTIDERWAMKDLRAALTPTSAGATGEEEDRDV